MCRGGSEQKMKTDLRVLKTKDALHAGLVALLKTKPLEKITITELCQQAKINRGTFYLHYQEINDVFEEYFREITADLAKSYEEPYRHVSVVKTSELDPSTIRIFHHIKNYESFYTIVFSKRVPLLYYYLLFDEVRKLFLNDHATSWNQPEIQRDLYCAYQANAIIGMILHWYQHGFKASAQEMNEQLVKIINLQPANLND